MMAASNEGLSGPKLKFVTLKESQRIGCPMSSRIKKEYMFLLVCAGDFVRANIVFLAFLAH